MVQYGHLCLDLLLLLSLPVLQMDPVVLFGPEDLFVAKYKYGIKNEIRHPAGHIHHQLFVVLPGKPGNPVTPGGPGSPGGPGIALQGPEKKITETHSLGQHRGCM